MHHTMKDVAPTPEDYAAFRRELVKNCQSMREMHDLVRKARRAVNLVMHPESMDAREAAKAHDSVMTSLQNSLVMLPQFRLWANSVLYGGRGHAVTPREVVLRLGMKVIKQYLDNVHYFDRADGYYPPEVYGLSFNEILIHQVLCHEFLLALQHRLGDGAMARLFPGRSPSQIQEELHTLGFEHDFGKLLMLKTYSVFKETFEGELSRHVSRRHLGVLDFEMALFQTSHVQAFAAFGRLQKMDEALLLACGQHHDDPGRDHGTGALLLILAHRMWKSDFSFGKEGDKGDLQIFENPQSDYAGILNDLKAREPSVWKGFDLNALAEVRRVTYARVNEVLTQIHGILEVNDRVYGVAAHEHAVERMPWYLRNRVLGFANEPEPQAKRRHEVMEFITHAVKFLEILYSKMVFLESIRNPAAAEGLSGARGAIRNLYRDPRRASNGTILAVLRTSLSAIHGLKEAGRTVAGVHGALTGRLGRGEKGPDTLLKVLAEFVELRNQLGDHKGHKGDDYFLDHLRAFRTALSRFLSLSHPFFLYYDLLYGKGSVPRENPDGGYCFENTYQSLVTYSPMKLRQDHPGGLGRVGIHGLKDGGSFDLDPFMISAACPQCRKTHVMILERLERGEFIYEPFAESCREVRLSVSDLLKDGGTVQISSALGRKVILQLTAVEEPRGASDPKASAGSGT